MKKSQNILLFSALIPIVAAPIAIVASCAGETQSSTYTVAAVNQSIVRPKLTDEMKAKKASEVTTADIKNIIKNDPGSLFVVTSGKVPDTFWDANLTIGTTGTGAAAGTNGITPNQKKGAVSFVYSLKESTNKPEAKPDQKIIEGFITFVGFTPEGS